MVLYKTLSLTSCYTVFARAARRGYKGLYSNMKFHLRWILDEVQEMEESCSSTELFSGEGTHQEDSVAIRGNSNATLKMLKGELILLWLTSCNIATLDLWYVKVKEKISEAFDSNIHADQYLADIACTRKLYYLSKIDLLVYQPCWARHDEILLQRLRAKVQAYALRTPKA